MSLFGQFRSSGGEDMEFYFRMHLLQCLAPLTVNLFTRSQKEEEWY